MFDRVNLIGRINLNQSALWDKQTVLNRVNKFWQNHHLYTNIINISKIVLSMGKSEFGKKLEYLTQIITRYFFANNYLISFFTASIKRSNKNTYITCPRNFKPYYIFVKRKHNRLLVTFKLYNILGTIKITTLVGTLLISTYLLISY